MKMESELKKEFDTKIRKELVSKLGVKNLYQIPTIEKITFNAGVGEAVTNPQAIDEMVEDFTVITGQKPVITIAKDSISNFKIRKGQQIGVKVTLRGVRMWYMMEKLIHIVLPRVKDFRGMPDKSFDGNGNYSFGLRDQFVFPEIDTSVVRKPRSLQVIISLSNNDDNLSREVLKALGFPFIKK
jgi:large subunit ribosomal protein L5